MRCPAGPLRTRRNFRRRRTTRLGSKLFESGRLKSDSIQLVRAGGNQTDQQRMPGFDTARSRQVSHRRRSARQIEIFVNGVIVQQLELYATEEGFFLSGRGGEPFTHRVA